VRDGEVQPACVQTCPAEALVFGDRKDPDSRVSQTMNNPRAYRVLEELNTDSSVVYLKKVDADAG
jgi:molybdopterin-containing oxidoreductase family iron-sulfur binding subunit